MLKLINVMEIVVEDMLDEVLRQEGVCNCEHCRKDVMAIALNELAPKYVVTEMGQTYETYRIKCLPQSRIPVYHAILKASYIVKEHPRHGEKPMNSDG